MNDPRYDAVGSSSLREELFNSYLKANGTVTTTLSDQTRSTSDDVMHDETSAPNEDGREQKRKERKERAVKEREERIQAERSKVNAEIDRSRSGLNREEAELEFRCAAYL